MEFLKTAEKVVNDVNNNCLEEIDKSKYAQEPTQRLIRNKINKRNRGNSRYEKKSYSKKSKIINNRVSIIKVVLLVILSVFVLGQKSNCYAKIPTRQSVKLELKNKQSQLAKLNKQYKIASRKASIAKKQYNKTNKGTRDIFMGTIVSTSPFVVYSNYILSPTKGWFVIKGGEKTSHYPKLWSGTVELTGKTQYYHGKCCKVVKAQKKSNAYKTYNKALKKKVSLKKKINNYKTRIKFLKIALRDYIDVEMYDHDLTVGETTTEDALWNANNTYGSPRYGVIDGGASWKSSDSSIVSVKTSKGGRKVSFTAKKEGTVTITATANISKIKKSFRIEVHPVLKDIELNHSFLHFTYDDICNEKTVKLVATCVPGNAITGFDFSSTDDSVVVVDENGIIMPVGPGVANIIVKSNPGEIERVCIVWVSDEWYDN